MPALEELKISHFRNLQSVSISPSAGLNLIHGDNGSGKTSLLEAISVLAHGRSFRTHKYRRLIEDSFDQFTVFAQLLNESKKGLRLGVNRTRSGASLYRIDGQTINSSAKLAEQLPLLVMDAHSFTLLEGSSQVRRQFFDWLVFHVKHEFKDYWSEYRKCLKQRNSLLRRDKITNYELSAWDGKLASLSRDIDSCRKQAIAPFLDVFQDTVLDFGLAKKSSCIKLSYQNGWKCKETPFELQLKDSFERDRRLGYTSLGPHKSDIKITLDKAPVAEVLSRGQQKMLVSALYLAEAKVYKKANERNAVFLLDDMPAELDQHHLSTLANWINQLGGQTFVTGVEANKLADLWPQFDELENAMFHVKHGVVKQI